MDDVDYFTSKSRKRLAVIIVMAAANLEKLLLFLLYQSLWVIKYALTLLTLSPPQIEGLRKKKQNESTRKIHTCTRDASYKTMEYLLDFLTIHSKIKLVTPQTCL